jgi:hypothetical protein
MPHIIVTAGEAPDSGRSQVLLRERVSCSDFESDHFASQLVERLGWAVGDATQAEQAREEDAPGERDLYRHHGAQRRSASVVTTAS